MTRKLRNSSGLIAYLDRLGLLASSDDDAIRQARVAYRKEYKTNHRKAKLKTYKSVTVYLNKTEYPLIESAAKRHKRSLTNFTKEAALAYLGQRFSVADIKQVSELRELLTITYCAIQKLFDDNVVRYDAGKQLLKRIEVLEQQVLAMMTSPKVG